MYKKLAASWILICLLGLRVSFCLENNDLKAQNARIISISELETLWSNTDDTLYVFNFWATWCRPCVAELPFFEKANTEYGAQKVKIVLVSLDFSEKFEPVLIPFLQKKKITTEVLLLDAVDYNVWLSKVDPQWGGAIPATLFVRNSDNLRAFFPEEFASYHDLKHLIDINLLQNP